MPTVPRYEQQVRTQAGPNAQLQANASIEAFGGGAANQEAKAVSGIAGQISEIAQQAKKEADVTAKREFQNKLDTYKNQSLYDPDKGALQVKGKDALDLPNKVLPDYDKFVQDTMRDMGRDKDEEFKYIAGTNRNEIHKTLDIHAGTEFDRYQDQTDKSRLDNLRTTAVQNYADHSTVENSLQEQLGVIQSMAKRKGMGQETIDQLSLDQKSQTRGAIVKTMLENDQAKQADAYFKSYKGDFTPEESEKLTKSLESGLVVAKGNDLYSGLRGMKLADGTPDEARMRSQVMAADIPSAQKEKVWDFVLAKAKEDHQIKNQRDAATNRDFTNKLITARKSGAPLEEALKIVNRIGGDPYDVAIRTEAAQKMYAPPSESDPIIKQALREGIHGGSTTLAEIDQKMQEGKINAGDWGALRNEYHSAMVDGKDPGIKLTNDRIKALAEAQFSDKKDQSEFINLVNDKAYGKSADERFKVAQDEIKKVPGTGTRLFDWFQKSHFEMDSNTSRSSSTAFGQAKSDLGEDVVRAIGNGVRSKGKEFTPAAIEEFSQSFGGYDKIQPGTPAYSAIQLLQKSGKPVTPANVKYIMDRQNQAGK